MRLRRIASLSYAIVPWALSAGELQTRAEALLRGLEDPVPWVTITANLALLGSIGGAAY